MFAQKSTLFVNFHVTDIEIIEPWQNYRGMGKKSHFPKVVKSYLGFFGLVDSFLIVDDGTAPDYADFVINSCAANTNPRAYLYLYD